MKPAAAAAAATAAAAASMKKKLGPMLQVIFSPKCPQCPDMHNKLYKQDTRIPGVLTCSRWRAVACRNPAARNMPRDALSAPCATKLNSSRVLNITATQHGPRSLLLLLLDFAAAAVV
jgi:hypothetical protein